VARLSVGTVSLDSCPCILPEDGIIREPIPRLHRPFLCLLAVIRSQWSIPSGLGASIIVNRLRIVPRKDPGGGLSGGWPHISRPSLKRRLSPAGELTNAVASPSWGSAHKEGLYDDLSCALAPFMKSLPTCWSPGHSGNRQMENGEAGRSRSALGPPPGSLQLHIPAAPLHGHQPESIRCARPISCIVYLGN
jgi:hypothetical protein